MEDFKSVFGNSTDEAYKIVSEYEVYANLQKIGIRIVLDLNGKYGYQLSHHYKGSEQTSPYVSSLNHCYDNELDALKKAQQEMFMFYDENDKNAEWVKSNTYI